MSVLVLVVLVLGYTAIAVLGTRNVLRERRAERTRSVYDLASSSVRSTSW
jgi:hypothetical protein